MSSDTVRAKVLCTQITLNEVGGHSTFYFSAVYSGDPNSENAAFSDATPSLNLSMTIAPNKPAAQLFEQDREYYLDFTRVAAVVDPRQLPIDDAETRAMADGSYAYAYETPQTGRYETGLRDNEVAAVLTPPATLDAGNASCASGAQDGGSADCSSSDSGGGSPGD